MKIRQIFLRFKEYKEKDGKREVIYPVYPVKINAAVPYSHKNFQSCE